MNQERLNQVGRLVDMLMAIAGPEEEDPDEGGDKVRLFEDATIGIEVREALRNGCPYFAVEVSPMVMDEEGAQDYCDTNRPLFSLIMESEAWLEAKLAALTSNQPLVASPV